MTTTTDQPKTALSEAQQARRECIRTAREVLQAGGSANIVGRSSGSLPDVRSVAELVDLATYVETGAHPWDRLPDDSDNDTEEGFNGQG